MEGTNWNVTNGPVRPAPWDSIFSKVESGDRCAGLSTTEVKDAAGHDPFTLPLSAERGCSKDSGGAPRKRFRRSDEGFLSRQGSTVNAGTQDQERRGNCGCLESSDCGSRCYGRAD